MKTILPFLSLLSGLAAQGTATQWFVEPVFGNDTFDGLSPFSAFLTIGRAFAAAAGTAGPDTVVLLPGDYVITGTLLMPPNVSLQGTNALNTILRGPGLGGAPVVSFTPTGPTDYDDVAIDGVTIVSARTCVQVSDGVSGGLRVRANPTIANCFLIGAPDEETPPGAVDAVVDIVVNLGVPFPGHDGDNNGFVENRPKFLNCTIVGGAIGMVNRRVDIQPRAESEPGLLNCLFDANPTADLEGIDSLAAISCAFANAISVAPGVLRAGRVLPGAVFNPAINAPLFVSPPPVPLPPLPGPLDLRILPGSPAIDTGLVPPALPVITWANGTTGTVLLSASSVNLADADCEGYGNVRLARNNVDIGADESGELIISGYVAGTTDFIGGVSTMTVTANPFPPFAAAPFLAFIGVDGFQEVPLLMWNFWEPANVAGARALLTTPPTLIPGIGIGFMNPASVLSFTFGAPGASISMTAPAQPIRTQFNAQALYFQATQSPTTNLQTFFIN